jgi:hypothetical protein
MVVKLSMILLVKKVISKLKSFQRIPNVTFAAGVTAVRHTAILHSSTIIKGSNACFPFLRQTRDMQQGLTIVTNIYRAGMDNDRFAHSCSRVLRSMIPSNFS